MKKHEDYRIKGDKSVLVGAISIFLCPCYCWTISLADSFICSYPECCGVFTNTTCCCMRCQMGFASFVDPEESMSCCVITSANTGTCKSYTQCCCMDYRRECIPICCVNGMGKDADMLPGACTYCFWNCFPVCGCCATVAEVKAQLAEPGAKRCLICVQF